MDNKLGIKMTRGILGNSGSFEGLMGPLTVRLRLPSRSVNLGVQLVSLLLAPAAIIFQSPDASALGLVSAHPIKPVHARLVSIKGRRAAGKNFTELRSLRDGRRGDQSGQRRGKQGRKSLKGKAAKASIYFPQNYIGSLKPTPLLPGVVYKRFKGPLTINVLDIDIMHAPVRIRPILASDAFDSLQHISQHAKSSHALAAINANYFKKNGTPLGTLIVDGEWVAGPIYDRVSLGVTKSGRVRVDRVSLAGILETPNQAVPRIWINNINQPRRTGSRLVAYTRRWGNFVRLPFEGCLVAVNPRGEITDKSTQYMTIPYGGYVLSDSKDGPLSNLAVGDVVKLTWRPAPNTWSDVQQAVSGGPLLIKDGNVFVDLKDEAFRAGWTSCHIKARTAAGVTNDHHLLLVTVEGSHTMWDLAKFLHKLGAVDALNLDGGGSTAMFVNGATVTQSKRKVASAIGIFSENTMVDKGHSLESSSLPKPADLVDFGQICLPAPAFSASSQADNNVAKSTPPASFAAETKPTLVSAAGGATAKPIGPSNSASVPLPGK